MTMEAEKFNKINQTERSESMKIDSDMVFELAPEQEVISFSPVGGDLEKIGIDRKEKIVLLPPTNEQGDSSRNKTIGFLIPKKGEPINRKALEKLCGENGWRLATGFELASLHKQLWKEFDDDVEYRKKLDPSDPDSFKTNYDKLSSLEHTVAIGDDYKGNYVATSLPQWDWSLTLYSPEELNDSFKFVVIKL